MGVDTCLICMFRAFYELLLRDFKIDFSQKTEKPANFMSSCFRKKLCLENLSREDILQINGSMRIIAYLKWIITYFLPLTYSNIQIMKTI